MVLENLYYQNGKLHDQTWFYNGTGKPVTDEIYRNKRQNGLWKYYENGKLKEEKTFSD